MHGRLDGLEAIPDCVDRLKKMVDNIVDRRESPVPGGCPLMNTAVETDDGSAALRARVIKALQNWTAILNKYIVEGMRKDQIDRRIDPGQLSLRIIGSLECALLISRLQNRATTLSDARQHLNHHLEHTVRAKNTNLRGRRSS